mgnify:CR=1 FL=1
MLLILVFVNFFYLRKTLSPTFTIKLSKEIISFGIKLIPHAIGGMIITLINRFFLVELISEDANGFYSLAFQLTSIVGFVTLSINNASVPYLFESLKKNTIEIKEKIVKWIYVYSFGLVCIGVFFSFFASFHFFIFFFVRPAKKKQNKSDNTENLICFFLVPQSPVGLPGPPPKMKRGRKHCFLQCFLLLSRILGAICNVFCS